MTPKGDGPASAKSPDGNRPDPRINSARDSFEVAWRDGRDPRIEDFVPSAEGEESPVLLRELIALEVGLRRSRGEQPTPQEYEQRFPRQSSLVVAAFAETEPRPRTGEDNADRSGVSQLPAPDFQATLSDVPAARLDDDTSGDPGAFWGGGNRRSRATGSRSCVRTPREGTAKSSSRSTPN